MSLLASWMNVLGRLGRALEVRCSLLSTVVSVIVLIASVPALAYAEPSDTAPPSPYPTADLILTNYHRVAPEDYFIPGIYGVYFLTPTSLNCGIWLWGSFGCRGDLPGAPPGVDRIGWFNGEQRVHYDWTAAIQFPNTLAYKVLPPQSYIVWNETMCAVMTDSSTYCKRGGNRFFITPRGTYLNG